LIFVFKAAEQNFLHTPGATFAYAIAGLHAKRGGGSEAFSGAHRSLANRVDEPWNHFHILMLDGVTNRIKLSCAQFY
jgi:hypothetical protein